MPITEARKEIEGKENGIKRYDETSDGAERISVVGLEVLRRKPIRSLRLLRVDALKLSKTIVASSSYYNTELR